MPVGPTDLGFVYGSQSPNMVAPYVAGGGDAFGGIANVIANAVDNYGQNQLRSAQTGLTREQIADARAARKARETLGQIIAQQFAAPPPTHGVDPIGAMDPITGELSPWPTVTPPTLDDQRAHAREQFTPDFMGRVIEQAVSAGDPGQASNLGGLIALLATVSRDADTAAGARGASLAPGHSVFQSDAHAVNEYNEGEETARNDADNATATLGDQIAAAASRYGSDSSAAVARERNAQDERASQVAVENARAARLDGQTVRGAVTGALGLARDAQGRLPEMDPLLMNEVISRTQQLLRDNPNLDQQTAATMAIESFVVDRPARGGNVRRLALNPDRNVGRDIGAVIGRAATGSPSAAPSPARAAAPAAASTPQAAPRQITSQAEYDALPSGTAYVDSRGRRAIKP